ncbi:tetratricopeptide repeat protein [Sorangium sp. So ce834]|uniref:tetratricopeptide repeat protein n=1 Tax=Sorangium sp. So ce834 TaxID=3133321 RepID=UPI003F5E9970
MSPEEREQVLEAFARLGARGDGEALDPLTTFVPLGPHRRALWPENVVILGSRGTGKTALFRLVNEPRTASRLRALFEDERIPEATWIDAFSAAALHPEVGTLEAYAAGSSDVTLRAFWMTHLLRRLRDEVPEVVAVPEALSSVLAAPVPDLKAWLPAAEANLGAVNAALDAAERALSSADRSVMATYDTLDRIGQFDPGVRRRYLSALLSLWLSLSSRYRRLRGKLFLRDDLLDAGELGFADASKLRARSEALTWDPGALLQVAARHLAEESEPARAWLRDVPGLTLVDRGEFGWMPGEMKSREVQSAFVARFAGKVIGQGVVKASSLDWMMGRLRDAHGGVTPRVLLWFLSFAAESARKGPPRSRGALVTPRDLLTSLQQTSRQRVQELVEEYPLVRRMENLRGLTLWLGRGEVEARLAQRRPDEPAGIPARGDLVVSELLRLGVLREVDDGKLDVPDIYRYAFEITPDYSASWRDLLVGEKQRAREQFIRELPILRQIVGQVGDAWKIAQGEIARGDFAAARARFARALEIARDTGNVRLQSNIWAQQGLMSLNEGDGKRAREEFEEAVGLARQARDSSLLAVMLWALGHVELRGGEPQSARSHLQESAKLYEDLNDESSGAESRLDLTLALLLLGDAQEGRSQFQQALRRSAALSAEKRTALYAGFCKRTADVMTYRRLYRFALQFLRLARAQSPETMPDSSLRDYVIAKAQLERAEVDGLEQEADALYARDQGWSLLVAAASAGK